MKIRIQGNSLRLRLMQQEVDQFFRTGTVEECIQFGPGTSQQMRYCLMRSDKHASLNAEFEQHCITVYVPVGQGEQWANSEEVGMKATQSIGADLSLSILIEKDFKCLTERSDEDESDAFPNPNLNC